VLTTLSAGATGLLTVVLLVGCGGGPAGPADVSSAEAVQQVAAAFARAGHACQELEPGPDTTVATCRTSEQEDVGLHVAQDVDAAVAYREAALLSLADTGRRYVVSAGRVTAFVDSEQTADWVANALGGSVERVEP
jgi:hypothetical protein